MMQGRMNIPVRGGGGEGGEVELNVFAQSTEPATKDGIWINTSDTESLPGISKFEYEGIEMSSNNENYVRGNFISAYTKLTDIPYNFYHGRAAAIGTDVYLFSSYDSSYYKSAYRYDTQTGTYTKLTDIPYNFYYGSAVALGTNVYLFGGSGGYTTAYKYDTQTGTYTQLTNIPYNFYRGSAVAVGTNVYLFGGSDGYTTAYKYDTIAGTYTKLTNIPYNFYNGSAVAVGTDVYLLGGSGGSTTAYKYDTIDGIYTRLTDIPYEFYEGDAVAIGTDVYLFGVYYYDGVYNCYDRVVKYNIYNGTYTILQNIPQDFYRGSAAAIGTNVYLFGGMDTASSHRYAYRYHVSIIENPKNNYIYIFTNVSYITGTKISNNIILPVLYAAICKGVTLLKYPAYYGNGTQWIPLPT